MTDSAPYAKSRVNRETNRSTPSLGNVRSEAGDRKSTRLNSSHGYISYAVFCLKKKKDNRSLNRTRPSSASWESLCRELRRAARPTPVAAVHLIRQTSRARNEHHTQHAAPAASQSRQAVTMASQQARARSEVSQHARQAPVKRRRCAPNVWPALAYEIAFATASWLPTRELLFFFFNYPAPPEISSFPLPAPFPI